MLYKKDISQLIFIYSISFIIIIYFFGLKVGFLLNPLNFSFVNIIKLIIPSIMLIVLEEVFRLYSVSSNTKHSIIILTIILLSLTFSIIRLSNYDLTDPLELFEFIGRVVISSILTNSMLTFISKNYGIMPTIFYRIIIECYTFFVPIIPDLGPYLDSVVAIVLPIIVLLRINTITIKQKLVVVRENRFAKYVFTVPLLLIIGSIIFLISGLFKFTIIAIMSNSMKPVFSRGDTVIIEKIEKEELKNLSKDDILVYKNDNKVIVHRIYRIIIDWYRHNRRSFCN